MVRRTSTAGTFALSIRNNEYLLLLAEQGLPGLLLWLAMIMALLVPAWRLMKDDQATSLPDRQPVGA